MDRTLLTYKWDNDQLAVVFLLIFIALMIWLTKIILEHKRKK